MKDLNQGKKIGIAGNHSTTIDTAKALMRTGYKIDCFINMSSDLEGRIAGYVNAGAFALENQIHLIRPFNYSLKTEKDQELILSRGLDLLIVFGWQRLIPDWFLQNLSVGAFGTHGSPEGLPRGRGRSLLNWSLIRGQTEYKNNLFRYDVGVDSGEVVSQYTFKITPWDNIASMHHKDQLFQQLFLLETLPQILAGKAAYHSQSRDIEPTYYPKRTPEDGVIDWNWKTLDIYNLIRALSKPYPGAFTYYQNQKIFIWRAVPFEPFPQFEEKRAGTILADFTDGTFVVRTNDGALLVEKFQAVEWLPEIDQELESQLNLSFEKLRESGIIG